MTDSPETVVGILAVGLMVCVVAAWAWRRLWNVAKGASNEE